MSPGEEVDARTRALLDALPGDGPAVVVRAPGRVNLIGEHTDYNGLPVLPIAIDRDVRVAARRRPDRDVELANQNPAFAPRRYRLASAIPPSPPGDWVNYDKAAAQALEQRLASLGRPALGGAHLRVDGTVPAAAGLSSSSALLVGCGLAHLALAGVELSRLELAELFAAAERYVGTLSGGMDQAASLLARAGHALRVDFHPLRVHPVRIPRGAALVVAHSLERAEKSGAARGLYNQRVVECGLAVAVVTHRTGLAATRLGDFTDRRGLLADLDRLLPSEAHRDALPALTGLGTPSLAARFFSPDVALADPARFSLRARVRHVLGEAERVDAAARALAGGDLEALGALMDASHASCAVDYAVSTPALDALVGTARAHGALGARLTGAGFGGAIVALVPEDGAERLLAGIDRDFYAPRGGGADARLVVQPSDGASILRL